jgi:hypothetical protein
MTDADFERLAWGRLDGTISADDEARLDAMLVSDGSAKKRFQAIEEVARCLSGIAQASPPAELRPRIDRAVAAASPRWRRPAVTMGPWRTRLAYLAAGLVAGAIAARLLLPAPALDRDLASGAMIATSVRPAAAMELDLAGKGTLAMWRSGALLDLDLAVREPCQLEVTLEAHQGGGFGIERVVLSGGRAAEATVEGGGLLIRAFGPGQSTVLASLRGDESGIVVRVTSDGVVLAEQEVWPEALEVAR